MHVSSSNYKSHNILHKLRSWHHHQDLAETIGKYVYGVYMCIDAMGTTRVICEILES